jgi:hypothetical protein
MIEVSATRDAMALTTKLSRIKEKACTPSRIGKSNVFFFSLA